MINFIKTLVLKEDYKNIIKFGDKYIVHLDPVDYSDLEYSCYECTVTNEPDLDEINAALDQYKQNQETIKLNLYKDEKIKQLMQYDASSEVNSFFINDKNMWLDAQMRQQLKTSLDAYKASQIDIVTKWFDGVKYEFPLSVWEQMLNSVEIYAAEALNVTEQHKFNIQNLTTVEDVTNYDFTTGYPNKLVF